MIQIRRARDTDAPAIRRIFEAVYGDDYTYPGFYDEHELKKLIFSDHTLMIVAEEVETREILGTASVALESGAYTDLVGEFGRLAVHPDARGRGIGGMLLRERIERIEDRLHVGYMEARVTHPFSVKNALRHGFAPVGFVPMKLRFGDRRESTAYLVRYFGDALRLRRNHPRVVPEVYKVACGAMRAIDLEPDVVVDESSPPYPCDDAFTIRELSEFGYSSLLRIERGRLRRREIFGPLRLHYGVFKLRAEHSSYLIAERDDHIAGAIGFTRDEFERNVRVFELICLDEHAIRFLLGELERRCREAKVVCIEVDVNADAPRMQRTLVELGYVPAAYLPALAFHRVERLDLLKMFRLLAPLELGEVELVSPASEIADLVLRGFERREVVSRIGELAGKVRLFEGLNEEQIIRLAAACSPARFGSGDTVFSEGEDCDETYLLLSGEVAVRVAGCERPVGTVSAGECLGEVALLSSSPHSATAVVTRDVQAGVLTRSKLNELVRLRPDIGVMLYRNLAEGLGEKLRRSDRSELEMPGGGVSGA